MSDAGSRHLGTMSSDRRARLRALLAGCDADAMGHKGIATVGTEHCDGPLRDASLAGFTLQRYAALRQLGQSATGSQGRVGSVNTSQHCRQSAQDMSRLDAVAALKSLRQRDLGSDSDAIIYISWSALREARTQYDMSRAAEDSMRQGKKRPLYNNRRRIAQAKPQARINHASVRGDPHRLRALAHLTSCHCSREN